MVSTVSGAVGQERIVAYETDVCVVGGARPG
jgi:hypothetical protein